MKERRRGTEEHRIWLFDLAHGNLKDEQILQGFMRYYVLEGYVMANVVDDMRFHTHYSMDQIKQSKESLERVIWVTAEPERVRKARIMKAKLRGYMDEWRLVPCGIANRYMIGCLGRLIFPGASD